MKQVQMLAVTALLVALTFPLAILPMPVALKVGEWLGRLLNSVLGRRRRLAVDNVRRSLPFLRAQQGWEQANGTPEQVVKEMFINLGRSVIETLKLYHGYGGRLVEQVEFRGSEHLEAALSKGRGVMLVTGHCSNWELVALAFGVRFQPVSSVARPLGNICLHRMLERVRQRYGNRIIYKQGALKSMMREFKENRIVAVLTDQAVSARGGCLVPFLGRTAWMTRMPMLMARKTGVVLLPAFGHREGTRYVVTFQPEIVPDLSGDDEVAEQRGSILLSRSLEEYVVRHPAEWFWVHNRWKRAGDPVTTDA